MTPPPPNDPLTDMIMNLPGGPLMMNMMNTVGPYYRGFPFDPGDQIDRDRKAAGTDPFITIGIGRTF